MRIAEIGTFANYCGNAIYTKQLVQELAKEHDVIVLSELNEFQIPDFSINSVRTFRSWFRPGRRLKTVLRILKQEQPDVVHIQYDHSLFGGMRARDLEQMKKIARVAITIHSEPFALSPKNLFAGRFERGDHKYRADLHLVHEGTGDALAHYVSRGIVPVVPIPMGTPYLRERLGTEDSKRVLGIERDTKVILATGFYVPEKGHRAIIEAFKETKGHVPNTRLIFAGGEHPSFPDERYFNSILADSWSWFAKGSVDFIDTHMNESELNPILCAADIFVLWSEIPVNLYSISASSHRAAAVGKPIVLYDSFRVADFTDGVDCLKAADTHDFARCIIDLLTDPELYQRISSGSDLFGQQTSWDKVATIHASYFRDMVENRTEKDSASSCACRSSAIYP